MDQDEFLDVVAHELKTPLTPLKAVAQLIRMRIRKAKEGRPLDPEQLDKNAALVERQVDRMDRLISGLLEVSRIARGRFELRAAEFDLAEVVRDEARRAIAEGDESERHHVEVEAPDELKLVGDKERVTLVVGDLITNAVKFSPSGGNIRVELRREGDGAVVTVRDEGVGIEADEIGALGSEPFKRGRRADGVGEGGRYAGLGVGLYLARIVAEGHGGRLTLESEGNDRGTTATLTLRGIEEKPAG